MISKGILIMSSFVCSDRHILTAAAIIAYVAGDKTVDDVFAIAEELRRENIRSVNYEYKRRSHVPKGWRVTPECIQISIFSIADHKAIIECLDYQSCARPDYAKGHAGRILIKAKAYFDSIVPPSAKSNIWSI